MLFRSQSEISQTGKRQIPHDFTYMWNLNNRTNITKQKQSQIQRTNWWLPEGVRGIGKIDEGCHKVQTSSLKINVLGI